MHTVWPVFHPMVFISFYYPLNSKTTIPFFTLDSIYSLVTSKDRQTIIITGFIILTGWRQTSWLFARLIEDLNLGLPRRNPASCQGGS